MNVSVGTDLDINVTLSRRNLEHLLKALDLNVGMPTLTRLTESGWPLRVSAEENDEHYGARTPGPGFEPVLDTVNQGATQ